MRFVIWKDGDQANAQVIAAGNMPDALDEAENLLGISADEINIIDATRIGEAEYYGVSHATGGDNDA